MAIKIFGNTPNPRTKAALLTAAYEKIAVELEFTDADNKSEEFKGKFPMAKIPALVDGEVALFECTALAYYLAELNHSAAASGSLLQTAKNAVGLGKVSLTGSTPAEKAAIQQWVSFFNTEFHPALAGWWRPLKGLGQYNKKHVEDSEAQCKKLLQIIENHLLHNTFFVTERITLADIFAAAQISRGTQFVFGSQLRSAYPNVFRFFNTVARQPWFAEVTGQAEPAYIENAIVYQPPAKADKAPKAEKAPKEAAKPKEEKPKKKEAANDEEEDDTPKEVKAKHPIEALGPAKSFPLDEWKRQYSNLDTPDALKWFEQNYDPQDYSLWHAVYKYPQELTQVFMSSNLITGFHTRLEGSRKFLFGSAGVYGKANDSAIQGVYLVRGSDGMKAFEVAPDAESYEFKPLNWSDPKDRELIENVWKWEGEFDGKTFADGKIFK